MNIKSQKGKLFVISGPSGVGKGTLLLELLSRHPEISLSVSATTRNPRPGEVNGKNYFFTSKDDFKQLIQNNELLEWAEFAGNYYGTYVKTVEDTLSSGKDLAIEIEVQGAIQVKNKIKEAVLIFIMPPSVEELKQRLTGRNTETPEAIAKRLSIVESEFKSRDIFDFTVVNDDIERAIKELEDIIVLKRQD